MLYYLVGSFRYAIGLRVVGYRQPPSDLEQLVDPLPYIADELGASIRDNRGGEAIVADEAAE